MNQYDGTAIREIIHELVDSPSPYDALAALDEQPATPTDLADREGAARSTSHKWLDILLGRSWVRRRDNGQYELTEGGTLIFQECNNCFEIIGRETLTSLSDSVYTVQSLRALNSDPVLPTATESDDSSPSSSTRTRVRRLFEEQEWIEPERGGYCVTTGGKRARGAYIDLCELIELVEDTRTFLKLFRGRISPPRSVLDRSSLIDVDASRKVMGEPLSEFTDPISTDLDRFRGVVPTVNPAYIQEFRPLLGSDVQMEIITDRTVLKSAELEYMDVLRDSFAAANLDMYITLSDISTGVAIFDDSRAQVGVYNDSYLHHASLDGTDDDVVDWGVDLYEAYWDDAWHIPNLASLKNVPAKMVDVVSD